MNRPANDMKVLWVPAMGIADDREEESKGFAFCSARFYEQIPRNF